MLHIIKDKRLYKNFLLPVFFLVMLFVFWLKYLDFYTNHNSVIKVPDFKGTHITELDSLLETYSLRYVIIDSVFDKTIERGLVVNQDPLPNTNVKENRRIYLTINSIATKKVDFPDVFDLTLRQAVRELQRDGFGIGKLEYQSDIATNKVLAYKLNGIPIDIGQELYYGSVIDLVVAQGVSDEKVIIPNLIGLSRKEANIILKSTSLNIGSEYFNNNVIDSNLAVIYKQYPVFNEDNEINIGSMIDLYFGASRKDSL
tara:strand:- start:773 stop:1543 length:771 start_codon:yes stop_codon:yes gene_type:complete